MGRKNYSFGFIDNEKSFQYVSFFNTGHYFMNTYIRFYF